MEATQNRRNAPRKVPRTTQNGEHESQLTPQEEAHLEGQILEVRAISGRLAGRLEDDYEQGRRFEVIKQEGLWSKARRQRGSGLLDFLSERSQVPRSTLEPRLIIARSFSPEVIHKAAARGACLSVMAEAGRGRPELRDELLDMALGTGSKGARFSTIRLARQAGNRVLQAFFKKKTMAVQSYEATVAEARAMMHREVAGSYEREAANQQRLKEASVCPHCAQAVDHGQPSESTQGPMGFLLRDGEAVYKQALEARVEAEREQKQAKDLLEQARVQGEAAAAQTHTAQETAAQARELLDAGHREQAALSDREAALSERQAVLESGAGWAQQAAAAGQPLGAFLLATLSQMRAEREGLCAEQAAAATTMAQAEQARAEAQAMQRAAGEAEKRTAEQEQAAAERTRAAQEALDFAQVQQKQAEETLGSARKQSEEMLGAAWQQAAATEQEQTGLAAQQKQVLTREAELARSELDLAERGQGLEVRDQALRALEGQVGEQQADLVRREKELAERSFRVHQVQMREMKVDWKEWPQSLDEVLEFILALSHKVNLLCTQEGRKFLERDDGLLFSEMEQVRDANRASIAARASVDKLMDKIIKCYEMYRPEELAEFNERRRVAKLAEEQAASLKSGYATGDDYDYDDDDDDDDDDSGEGSGGSPNASGASGGTRNATRPEGNPRNAAGPEDSPRNAARPEDGPRNAARPEGVGATGRPPRPAAPSTHQGDTSVGNGVILEGAGPANGPKVPIEVVIGSGKGIKKQWGLFGVTKRGGGLFIDINRPQVISIYGLQDNGKTSTILTLAEMMMSSKRRISHVPAPFGGVWAHFGAGQSYAPGIYKARRPNNEKKSVRYLTETLGALPEEIKAEMIVFSRPWVWSSSPSGKPSSPA